MRRGSAGATGLKTTSWRTETSTNSNGLHEEGGKLFAGDHLVLKGWESFGGWFWFGVERTGDEWFGLVQGFDEEWGYWTEAELTPLIRAGQIWPIKKCDLPCAGRRGG